MSTSAATPAPTSEALAALTAKARKAYSLKNYPEAVSLFARACESQALLHGSEDDPRNAHLLYLYGKALYQVAISKSDILGAAADASRKQISAEAAVGDKALSRDLDVAKMGKVIHFEGDENWDNTDSEGGDADAQEGEAGDGKDGDTNNNNNNNDDDDHEDDHDGDDDDDDDDMAAAWEVLDLARVLSHKALDPAWTPSIPINTLTTPPNTLPSISEPTVVGPRPTTTTTTTTADPPQTPLTPTQRTSLLTQLSDIYDLLGEISLESENFPQSILDLRCSLTLKLFLFPTHHKLVSEAHYKLSLALEFASAMEGVSDSDSAKGRKEAAEQMELAVCSVRQRITVEQEALASSDKGKGKGKGAATQEDDAAEKSLLDAKEIVAELEQRLNDLRAPVPSDELESANPMISGLLKSVLGETQAEQKRRLEEAIQGANDVSGLVRKKEKKVGGETPAPIPAGGAERGKRKLDDVEMEDVKGRVVAVGTGQEGVGAGSKKPKVEESLDVEEREGRSAAL
ncbi:hypothetical protein L211DRAFT_832324 [Terfezia boudieri ATCC MYA-4762]|uniref:Tetratricopeptide SHNi-TPR domain-containing protein n=1 Tax=Terfezia boudieri ATCC MYA-4762 TaxID=1051890 RepID=A0A3N4M3J3_9PEZI|nr:hypothetical protein L211DRAFT_832324 [Terfezia boudieri ATCC MYA-4762]